MIDLYKIYNNLPYPLRVLAASVRGYYLRWWRYGPETEQLIEEALERETWSSERWKAWQEEQIAYILHRAATKVPFYRDYWVRQRRHGNSASWDVLENWPILKKEALRENPISFVAEDCDVQRMFRDRTSGTTGTPLSVYLKRDTLRKFYALFEVRNRRWHGISLRERWAILGGQQIVPLHQKHPPFWVFNAGLNQLYLSTYHLSAKNTRYYIDALHHYAPMHMIVYPSSAFVLALAVLEEALIPPMMKVIVSNAELLLDKHKKIISEAFRCPVRNTYGMGEMVTAASECEKGAMHIWPEVGIIEVFDDLQDISVKNGEVGRLILTGLLNTDMPLIRYEVGDRGSLYSPEVKCTCGRNLPLLSKLEGRLNDMIVTPDGRRIFWINPVFYGLPIREAQIIQENLERIRVRFVKANGYTNRDEISIIKRLRARVGDVDIVMEPVDYIPRSSNGKFRSVISLVTKEKENIAVKA
jgi:phenylacetate-CoA ligase